MSSEFLYIIILKNQMICLHDVLQKTKNELWTQSTTYRETRRSLCFCLKLERNMQVHTIVHGRPKTGPFKK